MRLITVKMPDELVEEIDKYAIRHGLSRSEVIRAAIIKFLLTENWKEQQDITEYNEEIVVIE